MTKRDWLIRCIWIFIIILHEYFFHQDSAVINVKYEKRRISNPLYRSGHLRKRRGKYDRRKYRISEIKGFFVSQMIAISYLTALSVYGIAKFIFNKTNISIEIILLRGFIVILCLGVVESIYYGLISGFVKKRVRKKRNFTKEAKVIINEIIGDLQNQKILILKQYVSENLYLKLERYLRNNRNIEIYKIKKIRLIKEGQNDNKEIWCKITLARTRFYLFEERERITEYWKFWDIEEELIADEILSNVEYRKREEWIKIQRNFRGEERKYFGVNECNEKNYNIDSGADQKFMYTRFKTIDESVLANLYKYEEQQVKRFEKEFNKLYSHILKQYGWNYKISIERNIDNEDKWIHKERYNAMMFFAIVDSNGKTVGNIKNYGFFSEMITSIKFDLIRQKYRVVKNKEFMDIEKEVEKFLYKALKLY